MQYDYECKEHGIEEVSHSMQDSPKIACKACKKQMTRVISVPTVLFLGNSWEDSGYGSRIGGIETRTRSERDKR